MRRSKREDHTGNDDTRDGQCTVVYSTCWRQAVDSHSGILFLFFSFLFSSPLLSSLSHFLLFLPLFRYLILFISSLVSFFSADTRQSVTCMLLKGLTIQFPNSSEESIPPSSSLLPSLPPPYSLVSPLSPCDI